MVDNNMALISSNKITKINKNSRVQKETECTYNVFTVNEITYIQFDTYGNSERKSESKSSQTIQFDKETTKYIIEILNNEFDL